MSPKTDTSGESNPAVFRCCQAWRAAYNNLRKKGKSDRSASEAADDAYCNAMPPLFGVRNIRNFIACVTYGSVIGVIEGPDCTRLLYAAQVAHTTRRVRTRKPKTDRPSAKKSDSETIQTAEEATREPSSPPAQAA